MDAVDARERRTRQITAQGRTVYRISGQRRVGSGQSRSTGNAKASVRKVHHSERCDFNPTTAPNTRTVGRCHTNGLNANEIRHFFRGNQNFRKCIMRNSANETRRTRWLFPRLCKSRTQLSENLPCWKATQSFIHRHLARNHCAAEA